MKQIILLNLLLLTLIITGGCTENNSNESKQKQESSTQVTEKVSDNQVSEPITEENQELVDTLNNAVAAYIENAKEAGYYFLALYRIQNQLKDQGIERYQFLTLCDKPFTQKIELTSFKYDVEDMFDYEAFCTYDTWEFSEKDYNKGKDYYTLVYDKNTQTYYNVRISFKEFNINNKEKYYPIFNSSKLLK